MSSEYYILNGREVVPADNKTWGQWRRTNPDAKFIKQEEVGGRFVSTVFLGLDHSYTDDGPPLVFETMVFPSRENMDDLYCDRCSTYDQAVAMHEKACQWVRNGEPEETN